MGKIGQGILGGLSGKVGNIIGASWKGINYIRIKPVSVANPRTPGQVTQRNKFRATLEFLKPNLAFIKVGYKFLQSKRTAFNAAMSEVLHNAIIGEAPDFEVNYPLAQLSRGSLNGPQNGSASLGAGDASITWTDNSNEGNARADDKAMLLIYNSTRRDSVIYLDAATRSSESVQLTYPLTYSGDNLEVYMAYQAADGSSVSDSVHLGSFEA